MDKVRTAAVAPLKGLVLAALALPVFAHGLLTLLLWGPVLVLGLLALAPPPIQASRRVTNLWRRLIGAVTGVAIPVPYRPLPPRPGPDEDGAYVHEDHVYKTARAPWLFIRLSAWADDPASGRDLGWMLLYPFVAGALAVLPAALIAAGIAAPLLGYPMWTVAAVPLGLAAGPALVHLTGEWSRRLLMPIPPRKLARKVARKRWVEDKGLILVRGAALGGLALLGLPLLLMSLAGLVLGIGLGMVFLLPPALQHFRWLANLRRQLARDWSGVDIPVPYRLPQELERRPDGRYRVDRQLFKSERMARFNARFALIWKDPANWRDLLWLAIDPLVGGLLGLVPILLVCYVWAWTFAGVLALFGVRHGTWYGAVAGNVVAAIPAGVVAAAVGVWLAPRALRWHGWWTSILLRPTRAALLAQRVERLTQTRTDTVDAQAGQVRRIERDLHDGAQARLVAIGLTLGAIERLMETDPAAARQLLAQARDTSAAALGELRDLVRGIHPPVLSERGLGDAVRALALDSGKPVQVHVDLPGRPPAPVESAAYFAVAEALANAARHAEAASVIIDVRHRDGVLRMTVHDDGQGGADPAKGTGLRGIERRLGTFDGTLAVHSPRGGPTVVTMELPCALSSPKTSTSSATA